MEWKLCQGNLLNEETKALCMHCLCLSYIECLVEEYLVFLSFLIIQLTVNY